MEKVKKGFNLIPIIIIIVFLCLYYAYQNGYYERMTRNKIMLTNEQIEKFEEDILEGKDVTLEKYVKEEKNYSTKTGNISLSISQKIEKIFDKGIKFLFRKVSSFVE